MPMNDVDHQYLQLIHRIRLEGIKRVDRTGVGTSSIFGHMLDFDLREGFPVLAVKKTNWNAALDEMAWMLRGERNTRTLKSTIWDEWADKDGDLGPIYGYQWRHWGEDQIKGLLKSLRHNPGSRRHILSAWNNADLPEMNLPPCHMMAQFYVDPERNSLSCMMTQRSCDVFLGLPFNIVGYAFLTHVLADMCGYTPGRLRLSLGDTHLYTNHDEAVTTLLNQARSVSSENQPKLVRRRNVNGLDDIPGDIDRYYEVQDYAPNKFIPAPVAV